MLGLTPQSPDDELIKRHFPLAWAELERLRQLGESLAVPGEGRADPEEARPHLTLIQGGRTD